MEYKSKRVRDIITRETGKMFDLEPYKINISFGEDVFVMYKYPELMEKLDSLCLLAKEYTNFDSLMIEDNYYTSNIEGAKISTLDETKEICNTRVVKGKKEGMVLGYTKAVDVLKQSKKQPLDVSLANNVQQAVIQYFNENAHDSIYRDNSIVVGNDTEIVFKPCDCKFIDELFPQVFIIRDENVFIQAAIIHFFMVYLHPYFDGNGRTARLLMQEYIVRNQFNNKYSFPMSKYIHDNLSGYYKSIRLTEEDMDLTHFVVYILNVIEELLLDQRS